MRDFKWRKADNELSHPTMDEIQLMLVKCRQVIEADEERSLSIESGRLLVKRNDDHIDVYVYAGELTDG